VGKPIGDMNILVDEKTGFCIGVGDAWHGFKNCYPKPLFIDNHFELWQWNLSSDIQDRKNWIKIEPIKEEKGIEAKRILDRAYEEIASIIELPIDNAHDFVKEDLVEKTLLLSKEAEEVRNK